MVCGYDSFGILFLFFPRFYCAATLRICTSNENGAKKTISRCKRSLLGSGYSYTIRLRFEVTAVRLSFNVESQSYRSIVVVTNALVVVMYGVACLTRRAWCHCRRSFTYDAVTRASSHDVTVTSQLPPPAPRGPYIRRAISSVVLMPIISPVWQQAAVGGRKCDVETRTGFASRLAAFSATTAAVGQCYQVTK